MYYTYVLYNNYKYFAFYWLFNLCVFWFSFSSFLLPSFVGYLIPNTYYIIYKYYNESKRKTKQKKKIQKTNKKTDIKKKRKKETKTKNKTRQTIKPI